MHMNTHKHTQIYTENTQAHTQVYTVPTNTFKYSEHVCIVLFTNHIPAFPCLFFTGPTTRFPIHMLGKLQDVYTYEYL